MKVMQDWTEQLNYQQQATLLLSLRGPDGFPKHHPSKMLLYHLRGNILKAAHTGRQLFFGERTPTFMSQEFMGDTVMWQRMLNDFQEVEDELPLHYYTHLMHAAQIVAYKHPQAMVQMRWKTFYINCCKYLHCPVETVEDMDKRLNDFGHNWNIEYAKT